VLFLTAPLQETVVLCISYFGELKHLISQKKKSTEMLVLVANEIDIGMGASYFFWSLLKKVYNPVEKKQLSFSITILSNCMKIGVPSSTPKES